MLTFFIIISALETPVVPPIAYDGVQI